MSRTRWLAFTACLSTLVLIVGACGSTSAPTTAAPTTAASATARVVDLEIGDGYIKPATVEVKKGETITFNAKNASTVEVEIIVGLQKDVAADSGDSLKEAEEIAAGQSKSVTYTFDGDGPYGYGDQVDDHYAKGAKGTITLVP